MTKWKIYNEDAVSWSKTYDKGRFHALLTDTPYNLESITKRFGKNGSAKAKYGKDGVFQRSSKGFMNQAWDTDIAFRPETWEAFGEVLYPGAFGMAFSASRNWHRMAIAIEDAGFIIHPTMFFLWVQGQGFPKATRIKYSEDTEWLAAFVDIPGEILDGYRYGLQALKPAVEPIIIFQKPYETSAIEDITFNGAGALNIDAARIPLATDDEYTINTFDDGAKPWGNGAGHKYTSRKINSLNGGAYSKQSNRSSLSGDSRTDRGKGMFADGKNVGTEFVEPSGRWPSNLLLDENIQGLEKARFFYQVSTQLDEADPFLYQSKVSPKERNAGLDEKNNHPTLKPINLAKYLATLLLPPVEYAPRRIFVPFSGSGSEMIGAGLAGWEHVVGVEFDTENNYVEIAKKRLEHWLK